jgi:tetratricopeptide (TPR) repeat protein
VIYVVQVRHTPFFQTLGLDAKFYDAWARRIAAGAGEREVFFMSPLYPYFLAAIYRLFGRNLLLVRLIQSGVGAASAVLVYSIARQVFDRRIAAIAGFTAACYGALIFYDGAVLLEPLLVFLNLLVLHLLLRAGESGGRRYYLTAGAVLGVAAIGKATALLFAPAAAVWIWICARERRGADRRRGVMLFLLGLAVLIAPVTVRNFVVSRDFVVITSNGGLNFYIGNSEISTGGYVKPEGLDIVVDPDGGEIAEAALGRDLKASEVSAYWYAEARQFISTHPGAWAKLLVKKLSFAASSYELPQLENYDFQKRYSTLLGLPLPAFALVAPLGLVGLFLSIRRRESLLLTLFLTTQILGIVAFFVVARYRLPVVPVLIVGASYGVTELWHMARERSWRALAFTGIALAVLLILVNGNLYRVDRTKGFAQPHFRLGIIYGERGETSRAIREYRRSIEFNRDYPKSHMNLGALLSAEGRLEEAREQFQRAIALEPGYVAARVNLAMVLATGGMEEAALAHLDTVLGQNPENAMALRERGVILYRMGRMDESAGYLRAALASDERGEESAEARFYLALIEGGEPPVVSDAAWSAMAAADSLLRLGRVGGAAKELERACALAPGSGEPLRRMALLKREMGLGEEAVEMMRAALALDPTLRHGHFSLGVLLSEMGRHDEAIREYESELRMDSAFAPAHLNLCLTYHFHLGNRNRAIHHYGRYRAQGGDVVEVMESLLR